LAALNPERQEHANNNQCDHDEGDQNNQLKIGKHWASRTLEIGSIKHMHFQAKSSEIAEELTATAPLQFGSSP
jgi:hypothetical protein